jgi:hypothetical protein
VNGDLRDQGVAYLDLDAVEPQPDRALQGERLYAQRHCHHCHPGRNSLHRYLGCGRPG